MTVDPEISKAIDSAIRSNEQEESAGRRIQEWFVSVSNGNESLTNKEEVIRRIETILEEID